ncbi:hypothetical protein EYF80_012659 [Liparis tanakae]|uniref:Uncharacterized protein n=1 Tax=Liparis tanakae TaxID=230148 RepID=A0A4Z2IH24_9TELE|nr:hypothetical protein EYF80_012659 [Liparis tanakae]
MSEVEMPSVRWVGANIPAEGDGQKQLCWCDSRHGDVQLTSYDEQQPAGALGLHLSQMPKQMVSEEPYRALTSDDIYMTSTCDQN